MSKCSHCAPTLNWISEPEFWWSRKEQVYCFARQRGAQWANALKWILVSHHGGGGGGLGGEFYRYGLGGGVAEKDQGVCRASTPLIWPQMVSWWASVILKVIKLWPCVWNEECFIRLIFHVLRVLVLKKSSVYPLQGDQGPPPSLLLLPCLCISSLPWSATVWTCPLELREGRGGESLFISHTQEITARCGWWRHRKASVHRSPTGSCWVSWFQ